MIKWNYKDFKENEEYPSPEFPEFIDRIREEIGEKYYIDKIEININYRYVNITIKKYKFR